MAEGGGLLNLTPKSCSVSPDAETGCSAGCYALRRFLSYRPCPPYAGALGSKNWGRATLARTPGSAVLRIGCAISIAERDKRGDPEFTFRPIRRMSVTDGKSLMKRLLLASAVACLLTAQTANAKGCLEGAALGGVAGHMAHHTFLGIFGGCAGGMYVHHLYSKWKKAHPDGTMNDFVSENKDHLPAGWAERLSTVGDSSNLRAQ